MAEPTLAATAAVHAVVAASFLAVARAILRRRVQGNHNATAAIAVWWGAMAGYLLLQAALLASAALGPARLDWFLWSRLLAIPLLCSAAGGITYYVVYLITGQRRWRIPIALLYLGTAVVFHVQTFLPPPTALRVSPWLVELDIPRGPLTLAVYVLVGVPPILASAALLVAARHMEAPQRFRARLVGSAILAYLGSGLAAYSLSGLWTQLLALNGVGLLAAALVLLAYYPPLPLRLRYGLAEPGELDGLRAQVRVRREEFLRRGQELV